MQHVLGPDGEEVAPDPHQMRIELGSTGEVLLVYLDEDGDWVADSACDSIEEAEALAERDYGVLSQEWVAFPDREPT